MNQNHSQIEQNLENLAFGLYMINKTPEILEHMQQKDIQKIFTLEYVLKEIDRLSKKYYYDTDI